MNFIVKLCTFHSKIIANVLSLPAQLIYFKFKVDQALCVLSHHLQMLLLGGLKWKIPKRLPLLRHCMLEIFFCFIAWVTAIRS